MSNAWSLSILQRDYSGPENIKYDNQQFIDNRPRVVDRSLLSGIHRPDDCAMACDARPDCQSFSWWQQDGATICDLYKNKGSGPGQPSKSGMGSGSDWFGNGVTYSKRSNKDQGVTITTRPQPTTNLSFAAGGHGGTFGAQQCHLSTDYIHDVGSYPEVGSQPFAGGDCSGHYCCAPDFIDAGACKIPGIVTAVSSSTGREDRPLTVSCSYKSIDPTWLNNNKQSLGTYFDADNTKLATLMWCNNLSVSDLYKNQLECHNQTTDRQFRQFLLNRLNGSSWYTDPNAPSMVLETACGTGDTSVDSGCQSIIGTIPTSIPSKEVIDGMNTAITDGTNTVQGAVGTVVDKICKANQNSSACACYNIYKQGLAGCTTNPDLPGCKDPDVYAAVKATTLLRNNDSPAAKALLSEIETMEGDTLDAFESCLNADISGSGILLPAKRPNRDLTLNQCITAIDIKNSRLTDTQFLQQCNITTNSGSGPGPSSGPGSGPGPSSGPSSGFVPPDSTTSNTWIWILLAVCCCIMMLAGGGALVAFS